MSDTTGSTPPGPTRPGGASSATRPPTPAALPSRVPLLRRPWFRFVLLPLGWMLGVLTSVLLVAQSIEEPTGLPWLGWIVAGSVALVLPIGGRAWLAALLKRRSSDVRVKGGAFVWVFGWNLPVLLAAWLLQPGMLSLATASQGARLCAQAAESLGSEHPVSRGGMTFVGIVHDLTQVLETQLFRSGSASDRLAQAQSRLEVVRDGQGMEKGAAASSSGGAASYPAGETPGESGSAVGASGVAGSATAVGATTGITPPGGSLALVSEEGTVGSPAPAAEVAGASGGSSSPYGRPTFARSGVGGAVSSEPVGGLAAGDSRSAGEVEDGTGVSRQASAPRPTEQPVIERGGSVWVDVVIQRRFPVRLRVEPERPRSALDGSVLERIGIPVHPVSLAGQPPHERLVTSGVVLLETLALGGQEAEGVSLLRCERCADEESEGVMGADLIRRFQVHLDRSRSVLQVGGVEAASPGEDIAPFVAVEASRVVGALGGELNLSVANRAPWGLSEVVVKLTFVDEDQQELGSQNVRIPAIAPGQTLQQPVVVPDAFQQGRVRAALDRARWSTEPR